VYLNENKYTSKGHTKILLYTLNTGRGKGFSLLQNCPGWLWGQDSFPEVKQPGHEVDHSPPSSVEVKNEWSYASAPPLFLQAVKRGKFTFNSLTQAILT
jgi:hypothetical protein